MIIELYQSEGCPYCKKVREKLTRMGFSYIIHNPRQNEDRMDEMLNLGGKDQVPFLVVKDEGDEVQKTMYESDDIIDYLESLA